MKFSWFAAMIKATPIEKPCITDEGIKTRYLSSRDRYTSMEKTPVSIARIGRMALPYVTE